MITRRRLSPLISALAFPKDSYSQEVSNPEKPLLLNLVRSTKNPWISWWNKGGVAYAETANLRNRYEAFEYGGRIDEAVSIIESKFATSGPSFVLNFDSPADADTKTIADLCYSKGIYFVTHFRRPADYLTGRFRPYYAAHVSARQYAYGRATALILRNAMEGEGDFVALGGSETDEVARARASGMRQLIGEGPRLGLLEYQDARWSPATAFEIVRFWLVRYGRRMKGIWAANDAMALGAIEALRTKGLAGKIPVTGIDGTEAAILSIRENEMTATLVIDAFWRGGAGLFICVNAKNKINTMPEWQTDREIVGPAYIIRKNNVDLFENYWKGAIFDAKWFDSDSGVPQELPAPRSVL